jgi:hypothetical protein
MIPVLLAAALLTCDPTFSALFTPVKPALGDYRVCTTPDPPERVATDPAVERPRYAPSQMLEAVDAFGTAGPYNRVALTHLYGGRRVRVQHGWIARPDRFESITLLSPYPDAALEHLNPGTMVIIWTLRR